MKNPAVNNQKLTQWLRHDDDGDDGDDDGDDGDDDDEEVPALPKELAIVPIAVENVRSLT